MGRPRKAPPVEPNPDALEFLLSVQNDTKMALEFRIRAAIAAAPYQHAKKGNHGLKAKRQEMADGVSKGRFKPAEAPPINGKSGVK